MNNRPDLKVYLLRPLPLITINDVPLEFGGRPLDLFLYLADRNEPTHSRSDLLAMLYGNDVPTRRLSQNVLFNLPTIVKENYLNSSDQSHIQFFNEKIWVDSRAFESRASELLLHTPLNDNTQVENARQILTLYKGHFLQNYFPRADGLIEWEEDRRNRLASLRDGILDQLIQFYLRGARLEEAQHYAEIWRKSLEPGLTPLQYLIWITANRHQHGLMEKYLEELRRVENETDGITPTGLDSAEWQRHLQKREDLPLSILGLTPNSGTSSFPMLREDRFIGREGIVNDLVSILSKRQDAKVIVLTGLPGVGKTTVARLVIQSLQKADSNYKIIILQLTVEPDFESLLNSILEQSEMWHSIPLNLTKKRQLIKQLLRKQQYLIVIDEGNVTTLSDNTFVQALLDLLSDAHTLLVGQNVSSENHIPFLVEGLKPKDVKTLLNRQLPEIESVKGDVFSEIVNITGGLPVGLNIMIGCLRDQRFQINTFISILGSVNAEPLGQDNVQPRYDAILSWIWSVLNPTEKLILYATAMFDPTSGATFEDIDSICSNISGKLMKSRIDTLCSLSLLNDQESEEQTPHYTLHSLVFRFVQQSARFHENIQHDLAAIQHDWIEHFLDYALTYQLRFPMLDLQRRNIIRMFELVLIDKPNQMLYRRTVAAFCLIYPYLEKRGLYELAVRLISKIIKSDAIQQMPDEHIRLLHHAGQAAYKLGNQELAQHYLSQSLLLASGMEMQRYYGTIHLDLALLHLQSGKFSDAMNSFEESHQWAQEYNQRVLLCRITVNTGVCAMRQGYYAKSKEYFERVWDYIDEGERQHLSYELKDILQVAYNGLGLVALEEENYKEAESCYQKALTLTRDLNSPERLGYLYVNMGVTAYFTGSYESAHEYFLQAKIIAEYIQHDELMTLAMWNQGALNSALYQYEYAAKLLKTALIQAKEMSLKWMETSIYIRLGKLYFRQESLSKSRACFMSALEGAIQNPKSIAQALYGLALIELSEKDIVGTNDIQYAIEQISIMLSRLNIDRHYLMLTSYEELEKAQKLFQHDLDSHPQISRYRIVEGLWACRSHIS